MTTGGTLDETRLVSGGNTGLASLRGYSGPGHPASIPAERVEGRDAEIETLVKNSLATIALLPGQEQPLTHLPEGRLGLLRRKSDDRLVLILRNGGFPTTGKPVAIWGRDYSQPHGGCWKPALEIKPKIQQFLARIKKGI